MSAALPLASEPTAQGEQTLVPGVAPISPRQRLDALMNAPLTANPRILQKPLDIGLFDADARRQGALF
jgi:hypothetical protein